MNRSQRRYGYGRGSSKHLDDDVKMTVYKNGAEIEEVLPPKTNRFPSQVNKSMANRCCYVSPDQTEAGQLTDEELPMEQYQNILLEQYGFDPGYDPIIPDTINQIKELREVLCGTSPKVENCTQCTSLGIPVFAATSDESAWQNIENTDEIDKYMKADKGANTVSQDGIRSLIFPKNVRISDVPNIKIIAEKYSKFKKKSVELRKLDERVVCVEYDIYDDDDKISTKPVQNMRAFFSIKPGKYDGSGKVDTKISAIPSKIKQKFNITEEDLKHLDQKEIEIIDAKITENKTYLDDLRRILKRKQDVYAKRNRSSLDLLSLYEMAKRECPPLDFSATLLSKAELQEIKDLILKKCASSVHGISRRTVKGGSDCYTGSVISQSIVTELLRQVEKV